MKEPDHVRAHIRSSMHREQLTQSKVCGCFHCLETFQPDGIDRWIDERHGVGVTALCPRCGIDSVIGSESGYPITQAFLKKMHDHWF